MSSAATLTSWENFGEKIKGLFIGESEANAESRLEAYRRSNSFSGQTSTEEQGLWKKLFTYNRRPTVVVPMQAADTERRTYPGYNRDNTHRNARRTTAIQINDMLASFRKNSVHPAPSTMVDRRNAVAMTGQVEPFPVRKKPQSVFRNKPRPCRTHELAILAWEAQNPRKKKWFA